ncbi:MAG: hypothetical protein ACHQ1G_00295 [Planctomycetota bacterium]
MEQALRLVPPLEMLAPLRALLFSVSRPDERRMWSSSAPYLTLGKRGIVPSDLRSGLDTLLRKVTGHVAEQYAAALTVFDRFQRGDAAEAVAALLDAGRREEALGRPSAARAWYAVALDIAEGLPERRPEIASLLMLGAVDRKTGALLDAGRRHQRCLALAEAELHDADALAACLALGEIALVLRNYPGARAWYTRALRQARAKGLPVMIGRVLGEFAVLALREGDLAGVTEQLGSARTCFHADEDAADIARLLRTEGRLHEVLGDRSAAADYREALMWALRAANVPDLVLSIRLHLARYHLHGERPLEAEEEMRRAEQDALAEGRAPWLVRVYLLMGYARARTLDENGFVFFEQAIELCRSLESAALLEAETYQAYGDFRMALGDGDAARAYFERALQVLKPLGIAIDPSLLAESMLP